MPSATIDPHRIYFNFVRPHDAGLRSKREVKEKMERYHEYLVKLPILYEQAGLTRYQMTEAYRVLKQVIDFYEEQLSSGSWE